MLCPIHRCACIALLGLLSALVGMAEPARWFIPGPLGYEPGEAPPPPATNAFRTRAFTGVGRNPEEKEWLARNHTTPSLPFSHNLTTIVRAEDYAAHPEWFPWVGGQRYRPPTPVINWNPDLGSDAVVKRAAEAAVTALRADPRAESFALGVNDALVFGESPEALRWIAPPRYFRLRPDYSDLVYQFSNRVAAEVSREFPDRFIGTLAYYWCENVPRIALHPQVMPFLTADRSQGYDRDWWREEARLQLAWATKGTRRLGLYDYLDGYGFLVPRIHMQLLAEYLPRARRIGFTDYFGETSPNWGFEGPQHWLVAQLLARPDTSPRALLEEFYRRYFAEAAVPMRRYFEHCERLWMAQPPPADWLKHYRSETQTTVFPSAECAKLRALLTEAQAAARSEKVRQRIELIAATFGATERLVAFCEAKAVLSDRLGRGVSEPELPSLLTRYNEARQEFIDYVPRLRREQPLALYTDELDDFLWIDPAYDAAQTALEQGAPLTGAATPAIADAIERHRRGLADDSAELLRSGMFEGPVTRGQRIAELQYRADITAGWDSRLEPVEALVAEVRAAAAHTGSGGLHLANHKFSKIFAWHPVSSAAGYEVSAYFRGQLCNSTRATLVISWLDANNRQIVYRGIRFLPKNATEWVRLRVGQATPPGAVWVSASIILTTQLPGDWVEVDDVSLRPWNPGPSAR